MEWISVKDRLPEDSDEFLCYVSILDDMGVKVYDIRILEYFSGAKIWSCDGTIAIVTHWMPLPEPPKE